MLEQALVYYVRAPRSRVEVSGVAQDEPSCLAGRMRALVCAAACEPRLTELRGHAQGGIQKR